MRKRSVIYILVLLSYYSSGHCQTSNGTDMLISIDPPYSEYKSVYQHINYKIPVRAIASVRLQCYQYGKKDSTGVYDLEFDHIKIKAGVHSLRLNIDKNDRLNSIDYEFIDVLKRYHVLPPGNYVTYLTIRQTGKNETPIKKAFYYNIDSVVAYNSDVRNSITNLLSGKGKRFNASRSIGEKVDKQYGLQSAPVELTNGKFDAFYYKEWFIGYYKIPDSHGPNNIVEQEKDQLKNAQGNLIHNDLFDFTSVSSQFRTLNSKNNNSQKDDRITGTLDVTDDFSNGQEPGSMQDNNYMEVRGDVHFDALGMPMILDGYYTTQDNNRKAKASYLRFAYDIDKAKSQLNNVISNYKQAYNQTESRQQGLLTTGNELIERLLSERKTILQKIAMAYGIDASALQKYDGNVSRMSSELDTSMLMKKGRKKVNTTSDVAEAQAKIKDNEQKIEAEYKRAQELEAKAERYKIFLEQYKRQQYFDSALNYSRIQKLSNDPDVSYKKMLHSASGLLPESKVSSFVSGITKFEGGILNSYQSSYTMAGQNLKGATLGYDLGFAEAVLSAGKTEYVSRDGNVDRYNSYMGRLNFKMARSQKLSLIYYGYSPTQKLLDDNNFFKQDIGVPTFKQPVHIPSLLYEGDISKDLAVQIEGAASLKKSTEIAKVQGSNAALKAGLTYHMSFLPVMLKGEWEHLGKNFENSALPFTRSGTERYTASTQTMLFGSRIILGVQYNFLKQDALLSTGYNTKWGFDLKTNYKQYPNLTLSYKPFSTFRRYDDTFSIAQRPVIGSVFIARSSYQIKKKNASHRFMISYNKSSSSVDTESYRTSTLQAGYVYMDKMNVGTANTGWLQQPGVSTGSMVFSYFLNVGYSRNISKNISMNVGEDCAIAGYGLQRIAETVGGSYHFPKLPIILHAQFRYAVIKANELAERQHLIYGQIGMGWRFDTKNILAGKQVKK